jgi:hypothetical protein
MFKVSVTLAIQQKILEESTKMIDDSSLRLGKAVGELKDILVSWWSLERMYWTPGMKEIAKGKPELGDDEDYIAAQAALEEISVWYA